jgi:DNA polymerase III subunit epsilon
MNLIAFDLETTGIDPFTDVPVSYTLGSISGFINPGIPIPPETTKIHGITDGMVEDAIDLLHGVFALRDLLDDHWSRGGTVIGMNVSYDLTMLDSCLKRFGSFLVVGPVLDILVIDRTLDKYRKGSRKLSALCEHYGVELENAHSSVEDANACLEIFAKQLVKWPIQLKNVNNKTMATWYTSWLSNYSMFQLNSGKEPVPNGRFLWPIHSEEVSSGNEGPESSEAVISPTETVG